MKTRITSVISALLVVAFFTGCVTSKDSLKNQAKTSVESIVPAERDSYSLLNKVNGNASSFRVWVLFIPFGGISDRGLYDRAYKEAVEGTDGILLPHYTYKKVKIPLIFLTFVSKTAKVEGTSFVLKSDAEYRIEKKQ